MLTPAEKRALIAVAETLLPIADAGSPFARLDIVALVEEFFDASTPPLGLSTRLALMAIELGPLAWGFGPHRFSSLEPARRSEYLRCWDRSPRWMLRNVVLSMKVVVMGLAYDQPEIARAVCNSR